jgi:hypothetical protein
MSEQSVATVERRPPSRWAWWADRAHRYLLPAAGAVSVTLGVSLAIGARFPGDTYLPLALVVLGVGVLASVLARVESDNVPPPEAAAPTERFIADTLVICPSCSARSFQTPSTPSPHPSAWRVPDPPRAVPSSGGSAAFTANPGDFLWGSWIPESGRLPVELIGPVPETAYLPHRPGAPTLHEEGEPVIVGTEGSKTPLESAPPSAAPSTSRTSGRSWASAEVLESEVEVLSSSPSWKAVGSSALDFLSFDPLLQEALNPIPPHLRTDSHARNAPAPVRAPRPREPVPAGHCADCGELVPDLANWRRCSDCHHLLCAGCMVSTLLTRERAWCSHCAELRNCTAQ